MVRRFLAEMSQRAGHLEQSSPVVITYIYNNLKKRRLCLLTEPLLAQDGRGVIKSFLENHPETTVGRQWAMLSFEGVCMQDLINHRHRKSLS